MRKNLPVTQREIHIPEGMRLISTTTLKGVITYCDDDFVTISGYSRDELIGQAHNLIRHPDMPPAVFADMWEYLKAGKAWMGVVKNRAKSGDHYWVSAYATPIWENGQMVGYESVRVAATREQIARAERLYKEISEGRLSSGWRNRVLTMVRSGWPFMVSLGLSLGALAFESPALAVLLVVVGHVLGFGLVFTSLSNRLRSLLELRPDAFQDPIVARTYSDERGLMSRLALMLVSEEARIRTALARVDDQAEQLLEQVHASHGYITEGAAAIARQRAETDQTASAINQMTVSIQEVVESVNHNARGFAVVADEVRSLAQRTRQSTVRIHEVVEDFRIQVDQTVNAVRAGEQIAGDGLNRVQGAADALNAIVSSVDRISESFITMSAAFEEQSQVSDEINRQVVNIASLADQSDEQADAAKQSSDLLSQMAGGLKDLIARFVSKTR